MDRDPQPVTAAPNKSEITARILAVSSSERFPERQDLRLEVLESSALEGPNFAKVGAEVDGFTFQPSFPLSAGDVIRARAEYLGDARSGRFQLEEVEPVDVDA